MLGVVGVKKRNVQAKYTVDLCLSTEYEFIINNPPLLLDISVTTLPTVHSALLYRIYQTLLVSLSLEILKTLATKGR